MVQRLVKVRQRIPTPLNFGPSSQVDATKEFEPTFLHSEIPKIRSSGDDSRTLLVRILLYEYSISWEELDRVFSRIGDVEYIEVFDHGSPFHSRIRFRESKSVVKALECYDRRFIYDGYCQMELSLEVPTSDRLIKIEAPTDNSMQELEGLLKAYNLLDEMPNRNFDVFQLSKVDFDTLPVDVYSTTKKTGVVFDKLSVLTEIRVIGIGTNSMGFLVNLPAHDSIEVLSTLGDDFGSFDSIRSLAFDPWKINEFKVKLSSVEVQSRVEIAELGSTYEMGFVFDPGITELVNCCPSDARSSSTELFDGMNREDELVILLDDSSKVFSYSLTRIVVVAATKDHVVCGVGLVGLRESKCDLYEFMELLSYVGDSYGSINSFRSFVFYPGIVPRRVFS